MERLDVTFGSGGEQLAAWLYTPDAAAPRPIVVLAHGFGGVRTARLDAFARRFAEAGLAALVFDYRHFGDSGGEPRQLIDIERQLDDWRAAVAFARSLDGVDPGRVALWGTSFSGGHVAVIAAEDHRVAAAVSQAPFVDGVWALRAAGPANMARLTFAGLRDEVARLRGKPPYTIPIVGPPGSMATMNSPDAEPGYRALFSKGDEFVNEAAGRIGLRVGLYRPIRYAARIACPWLLLVCDRDVVTPPQPTLKAAARAPRGEVRRYDLKHFDIYVGEAFERAVADEVAFLERHLLMGAPAPAAVH
jgi:fermentation-respiration switch protein FrsA (DUF1100 family)